MKTWNWRIAEKRDLECRRALRSEAQSASWLGSIFHHHPGLCRVPASRIFAWDVGAPVASLACGLCLKNPAFPVARESGGPVLGCRGEATPARSLTELDKPERPTGQAGGAGCRWRGRLACHSRKKSEQNQGLQESGTPCDSARRPHAAIPPPYVGVAEKWMPDC